MGRWLTSTRRFLNAEDGSLRQKAIRSTIWVGLSTAGMTSLSLVKSVILARLLTPDHFGLMAACMVVIRAVEVFTETGLGPALIQRKAGVEDAVPTAFSMAAARGVVLAAIVFAIAPFVSGFYEEPRLTSLLEVLSAALLIGGLSNLNTIALQKDLNFRRLFRLQQAVAVTDLVVTVALAVWLRNVWALVLGQVIKALVALLLSYTLVPGRPRFGWDGRIARELLAYGRFITGVTVVVYVTTEIDNVVIGKILGMQALGIYVVAYMLANLPATHLSKVISGVMFPAYSKLQDDRSLLLHAYLETTRVVSTVAMPMAVGLAVLADELVTLVYGQEWRQAATVLPLLCVFGALRAVSSTNGYVFNAIGKPQIPFYVNLVKLGMIAALIVPMTRQFNLVGAAAAVTLPSIAMFAVSYIVFAKTLQVRVLRMVAAIVPSVLASAIMASALLVTKQWCSLSELGPLALAIVGSVVLYTLANWRDVRRAVKLVIKR
jgi:O-antigen/teichoic acid export membrane protein